jgi:hypothetical protein
MEFRQLVNGAGSQCSPALHAGTIPGRADPSEAPIRWSNGESPPSVCAPDRNRGRSSCDTALGNSRRHHLRHSVRRNQPRHRGCGRRSQARHQADLRLPRAKGDGSQGLDRLDRGLLDQRKRGARCLGQALVAISQVRQIRLRRQGHQGRPAELHRAAFVPRNPQSCTRDTQGSRPFEQAMIGALASAAPSAASPASAQRERGRRFAGERGAARFGRDCDA